MSTSAASSLESLSKVRSMTQDSILWDIGDERGRLTSQQGSQLLQLPAFYVLLSTRFALAR